MSFIHVEARLPLKRSLEEDSTPEYNREKNTLFSSLRYILSTKLAKCQTYFFRSAFKCNAGCFSKFGIKALEGPWNPGILTAISKSPF